METGRIYPTGLQQAYAATVRPPLHAYPGTTTPRKNGSYSRLSEDYFPSARRRGEAHPPRPEGHRDIGPRNVIHMGHSVWRGSAAPLYLTCYRSLIRDLC